MTEAAFLDGKRQNIAVSSEFHDLSHFFQAADITTGEGHGSQRKHGYRERQRATHQADDNHSTATSNGFHGKAN